MRPPRAAVTRLWLCALTLASSAAHGRRSVPTALPLSHAGCDRTGIGHRTRAHSTRLKQTSNGRAIVPHPERSGDLAEALQLIGAEVELDGPGRVQDGLRA